MVCKYNNNYQCSLVHCITGEWRYLPQSICNNQCKPEKILQHYKIVSPPNGVDLLKWIEEYIESGLIVIDGRKELRQKEKEHQDKHDALLAQLPKGFQLAKNLKRHLGEIAKHFIETKRIKTDQAEQERRLDICLHCPANKMIIKEGVMRCVHKNCGCQLNNPKGRPLLGGKVEYEALHCDEKHW